MSRSLILSFNATVAKYSRLNKKVRKSISKGEFWRYTRTKRNYLLNKIEKLKRRLTELRLALKMASAGLAAGLMMMSVGEVSAQQSTLGPFIENQVKNPFPKPAFAGRPNPNLVFWDMDKDGDLDASLASSYPLNYPEHFKNVGTKAHPIFEEYYFSDNELYWYSVNNNARVAFADVDDDGDLDAVVGMETSDDDANSDLENDIIYFYRNYAESPTDPPAFQREFNENLIFNNVHVKRQSWPAFTDFDKDGDLDFVLAGEYDDEATGKTAWIQFFRNDKTGHEPGVDATYTPLEGSVDNPLYLGESVETTTAGFFDIAFADLDGDGDDDFIKTDQHGQITYKRNDGGVFVTQEGTYTYKPNGASTGNPLGNLNILLSSPDPYKSLAFGDLDGDGDQDLVIGTNNIGTLNSPYIYVKNTGNGVMVADKSYTNPISGFSMGDNTTATFIDYDKDGDQDFLTTGEVIVPKGSEGATMNVLGHMFFKNNNGVFESLTLLNDPFATLVRPGGDASWLTADIDGDSDLDALYLFYSLDPEDDSNTIVFIEYQRNDNGTFVTLTGSDNPLLLIQDMKFNGLDLEFGDLNGDGLPDAVAIGKSNAPYFFENTGSIGNPVFELQNSWRDGTSTEVNNLEPKLVDLDNDGDNDMVLGKYHYIWYYENIGDSKKPKWKEYQEQYTSSGTIYNKENPFGSIYSGGAGIAPDIADADGDGDKDLIFAAINNGYFTYYENQNPAPAVVPGSTLSLSFEVNKPVKLAPLATLTDQDGDKVVRIEVKAEPYQKGLEKLQLANTHGTLVASWNDINGVLTISGTGTYLEYQSALRDIEYVFTGASSNKTSGRHTANGKAVQKTVTVFTLDSDLTVGPSNTTVFTISGDDGKVNTPPTISGTATSFYVNGELVINNKVVITDPDSVLTGAAAVFTTGFLASEDILLFTNQNGITGAYNSTAGLLSLSGSASVVDYQAALRSVRYKNSSATPSTQDRIITFTVNDGGADVPLAGNVISINKPPVITAENKRTEARGNIAFTVAQVLSDPDNNLDLSTLVVTSQQGGLVSIANGIITVEYDAVPNFEGNDTITITVCDTGGRCNTTTLSVEVGAAAKIYTGMSPNGDGVNDWFHIDFLPKGTEVGIYNRWGDAIFETDDYDVNEPSKRFEGKNKNGTEVVAGSYFYKVKFPGKKKAETGYVLLNR